MGRGRRRLGRREADETRHLRRAASLPAAAGARGVQPRGSPPPRSSGRSRWRSPSRRSAICPPRYAGPWVGTPRTSARSSGAPRRNPTDPRLTAVRPDNPTCPSDPRPRPRPRPREARADGEADRQEVHPTTSGPAKPKKQAHVVRAGSGPRWPRPGPPAGPPDHPATAGHLHPVDVPDRRTAVVHPGRHVRHLRARRAAVGLPLRLRPDAAVGPGHLPLGQPEGPRRSSCARRRGPTRATSSPAPWTRTPRARCRTCRVRRPGTTTWSTGSGGCSRPGWTPRW